MFTCRIVTFWCLFLVVYFSATCARDEDDSQKDLWRESPLNFRLPRSPQRQRNTSRTRPRTPTRPAQAGSNQRTLEFAGRVGAASSFFAAKLFSILYPQLTANTIISPHSVHTALTMLALGARRTTETELLTSLGLRQRNFPKAQVHRAYQALLTALSSTHESVTVVNANAVYVRPGIPLEVPFRNGLQQQYNARFDHIKLDDPNGPEASINSWVSNITRGKITELLTPGTITQATSLVLLNAIFFNASWSKPFNPRLTTPRPFNSLNNGVQSVDTMQDTGFYNYSNHRGSELIELPFKGNRLSMFIILPNENSSIGHLRQELFNTRRDFNPIQVMLNDLEPQSIKLYLPKFKVESLSISLKDALRNLGIRKAFIPNEVNLSGISSTSLVVDDVLHKAVIDINEQGCEAAAATAILISRFSAEAFNPREVKVDRPFVYLIQDKVTKTILFLGAYIGQ